MDGPLSPASSNSSQCASQLQHQYGTRIRKNSVIKLPTRLRQSSSSSTSSDAPASSTSRKASLTASQGKSKCTENTPPQDMPEFPPAQVMLHPDDASNKTLLAIGRAFIAVDNRAMTIKDLAKMAIQYGLPCPNPSAAGQAITTYIRNHLARCESQQDHPLLLSHVLSGTAADDDLYDALHSVEGGSHVILNVESKRLTNFRRGTVVWYLSRATGAPCPFQRAGIRLCDYTDNGKVGGELDMKERRRVRDRQRRLERCGDKRKRSLRCYDTNVHATSSQLSSDEEPAENERPPKVKLVLRLQPRAKSSSISPGETSSPNVIDLSKDFPEEDAMSVGQNSSDEEGNCCLPPYPRRSISIPHYKPCLDSAYVYSRPSPYDCIAASSSAQSLRRAPSLSHSVASPPPDSDEDSDDEDFRRGITMAAHAVTSPPRIRQPQTNFDYEFGGDWNADIDDLGSSGEDIAFYDIAQPDMGISVKEESRDVEGVLAAWESEDIKPIHMSPQGLKSEDESTGTLAHAWSLDTACALDSSFSHVKREEFDSPIEGLSPLSSGSSSEDSVASIGSMPLSAAADSPASEFPLTPITQLAYQFQASHLSPLELVASFPQQRKSSLTWKDVEISSPVKSKMSTHHSWPTTSGSMADGNNDRKDLTQPAPPSVSEISREAMSVEASGVTVLDSIAPSASDVMSYEHLMHEASSFDLVTDSSDEDWTVSSSTQLYTTPSLYEQIDVDLTLTAIDTSAGTQSEDVPPLSATEREVFHALCGRPEWDNDKDSESTLSDVPVDHVAQPGPASQCKTTPRLTVAVTPIIEAASLSEPSRMGAEEAIHGTGTAAETARTKKRGQAKGTENCAPRLRECSHKPLRRSKRVAATVQPKPIYTHTRSRKASTRSTLS